MHLWIITLTGVGVLAAWTHAERGTAVVVDLSKWNRNVNLKEAQQGGIKAVIHKATQGVKLVDRYYAQRRREARDLGLLWGAYHFGQGGPGKEQAQHFLKTVGNTTGVLLALDIEEHKPPMTLQAAEDFINEVYNQTGRYPFVYGSWFLQKMATKRSTVLVKCPLWQANYNAVFDALSPWRFYSLWQYTDGRLGSYPYTVPGIGPCDQSRFNDFHFKSIEEVWALKAHPA